MELVVVMMISFLLFLLKLILVPNSRKKSKSGNSSSYSHIPGPKPLPLIGNLHLMLGGGNPHHLFKDLAAKYGPLMHLQLGQTNFLIVSSLDFAKQVLITHGVNFSNRPPGMMPETLGYNYTDIAFSPYGDHWRHLRKICKMDLLSNARVQYLRPLRQAANMHLARSIASYCHSSSPADLSEMVYLSSFDLITRAAFGPKTKERAMAVTSVIDQITQLGSGFIMADLFPSSKLLPLITGATFKFRHLRSKLDRIFDTLIDEHRAAAAHHDGTTTFEDLTDALLKIQGAADDGTHQLPLDTNAIKGVLQNIFVAGTDTSGATVEWAMSELIKNPSKLNKAQEELRKVFDGKGRIEEEKFDELKYLKLIIKETLRLHPPGPLLLPRMNSERCEINGYEIPAKTRVLVNAWALGRDPEYWNEAEKFIPERFDEESSSIDFKGNNLEYIPFGAGRRMCPGISLGIANVEFMLAMLLYHFDWEMPNGMKSEELDMSEAFGTIVSRKNHLHLVPTLKRPF